MRLLKASTFEIVLFEPHHEVPPYAILSHTWEGDEVTFDDFPYDPAKEKPAWRKVRAACERTRKDGLEYIWIDSCCINRRSNAELSESINSMFTYYEEAVVCYAYLADVPVCDLNRPGSAFERSRWFNRGWTLQELLAPAEVLFFSQDWTELGSKNIHKKNTLCTTLSRITHIDEDILMRQKPIESASVAQRMCWAAHRKTTRPEDIAYCLVGIFSVRMSFIYGEKEKAFIRLQEHIMERINDHSIFAWTDLEASKDSLHGMLATSPSKFADCHDILPCHDWPARPYSMTNVGLQIDLPIIENRPDEFIAVLGCERLQYTGTSFMGIFLKRVPQDRMRYARIKLDRLVEVSEPGSVQTIHVPQSNFLPNLVGFSMRRAFELRQPPGSPYEVTSVLAQVGTNVTFCQKTFPRTFEIDKGFENHLQCYITIRHKGGPSLLLMLGTMEESAVGFDAIDAHDPSNFDIYDFGAIRKLYSPIEFGNWLRIQNHLVRMDAEIRLRCGYKYYVVDVKIHPVTEQPSWDKPYLAYLTSRPAIRPMKTLASTSKPAYNRWMVFMMMMVAVLMMLVMVVVTRLFALREGSKASHDLLLGL